MIADMNNRKRINPFFFEAIKVRERLEFFCSWSEVGTSWSRGDSAEHVFECLS
jgi:hypothetical protein